MTSRQEEGLCLLSVKHCLPAAVVVPYYFLAYLARLLLT